MRFRLMQRQIERNGMEDFPHEGFPLAHNSCYVFFPFSRDQWQVDECKDNVLLNSIQRSLTLDSMNREINSSDLN